MRDNSHDYDSNTREFAEKLRQFRENSPDPVVEPAPFDPRHPQAKDLVVPYKTIFRMTVLAAYGTMRAKP